MGSAADDVISLYRRHATAWTRARGERLDDGGWLERFCGLLPSRPAVLDLGCGSGVPIAKDLAARSALVTGVDSSPEMIALFRVNLPSQTAKIADMRVLDLGSAFDGIIAWDSFFHLSKDDQRAMFPVFRRHAAPGAALMFTSGPAEGEAIGMLEGEPLYHASLAPAEYRERLDEEGFEMVDHTAEDPTCGGRTVWLARLR